MTTINVRREMKATLTLDPEVWVSRTWVHEVGIHLGECRDDLRLILEEAFDPPFPPEKRWALHITFGKFNDGCPEIVDVTSLAAFPTDAITDTLVEMARALGITMDDIEPLGISPDVRLYDLARTKAA